MQAAIPFQIQAVFRLRYITSKVVGVSVLLTYLLSWLTSSVSKTPAALKLEIYCTIILVVADTVSGVVAAALAHKLRSRALYRGVAAKLAIYFSMACIGGAVSLFLSDWHVIELAAILICASEGTSIVENLVKLQVYGIPVGRFRTLLAIAGQYLDWDKGTEKQAVKGVVEDKKNVIDPSTNQV